MQMVNVTHAELVRRVFSVARTIPTQQFVDANTIVETIQLFDLDAMRIQLRRTVWAKALDKHHFDFPTDWKQALKERFAPRWVLRRWPVKYAELDVTVYHSYPALIMPRGERSVLQVDVREVTND